VKRRALVSVSDKRGIAAFARKLSNMGFEIISTGGTAKALQEARVPVVPVSEVTGEPEILGGRVKTLHPKIHGGILADLTNPDHAVQLAENDIGPIDLVCINLYPFEQTVAGGADEREAIEQIDIGGPAMMRAAAKNFETVTVVPDPSFYRSVLAEIEHEGEVSREKRRELALAAFERTASYDAAISAWFAKGGDTPGKTYEAEDLFPPERETRLELIQTLRYGENPHQRAAYYAEEGTDHLLLNTEKLQGKALSFNNLYDLDAARTILTDLMALGRPEGTAAAVIVKHANPCGAAVASTLPEAYRKALACDPTSAFGGIVALSGEVDGEFAEEISQVFTEVLSAARFTPEAREVLSARPNMNLLEAGTLPRPRFTAKQVSGGMLLQEADTVEEDCRYKLATATQLSPEAREDLRLAWVVAKSVKSNAIVLVRDGATVGVGAGQMSRVDAARIAVEKAGDRCEGAAAASDAFFPFADGLEALAKAGVRSVIQPGGSKRDDEVIAAADRHGMAMVLTGTRHFYH
jgi:phosphoribosylaminoimidazolecarboxamide formyltransferase/IMP cyclohydrolase